MDKKNSIKTQNISFPFPRYQRAGECRRCGACCLIEDPPCSHLEMKNGIATCQIFNSPDRPLRCKLFPEMPLPSPFKDCGYYFLDAWDNDKIVGGKHDC